MRQFFGWVSVVAFVVAAVLFVAYYGWWPDSGTPGTGSHQPSTDYSRIEEGLYMGGSIEKPPPGTVAVLNLCEIKDPYQVEFHIHTEIPDSAPAPSMDWLKKRVAFVDEQRRADRQVYVHCAAGISRAGMVTTAYLMTKHNWTRDEALAFIRKSRPQVNPNPSFMELLKEYEAELKEKREASEK